jgi:hypothetical protein
MVDWYVVELEQRAEAAEAKLKAIMEIMAREYYGRQWASDKLEDIATALDEVTGGGK